MYTDHCAGVCFLCVSIQVRLQLHLCSGIHCMEFLPDGVCVLVQVKWSVVTACTQTAAATQTKKSAPHQTHVTDDRKPRTLCKRRFLACGLSALKIEDLKSASKQGAQPNRSRRLRCHDTVRDLVTSETFRGPTLKKLYAIANEKSSRYAKHYVSPMLILSTEYCK